MIRCCADHKFCKEPWQRLCACAAAAAAALFAPALQAIAVSPAAGRLLCAQACNGWTLEAKAPVIAAALLLLLLFVAARLLLLALLVQLHVLHLCLLLLL
jgi:hypothetical protein